ncbi:hypothetical protein DL766_006787 [Monosporascus sp. MC13-8B]|uniref:Amino acid permease/ SLC12A domain-containing protein n=1 Tax=Monosporascus cannonballus TaxID=155416 RepID=A0ABY0GZM2_9PEZI|nr:hypothetical protein DL762_007277 [Monosporascus cannonballus]RYO86773.1 hypothetical protein DL763_006563 [Monosporascus cannonballus]RYP26163.1 hypothetical protein DL766_006787 [Monosporascus sp. MC13-8B]
MVALGSSIGMGLWLGSGVSLTSGGPAGILLRYLLAGSMILRVSPSIDEMLHVPSAFRLRAIDRFWANAVPIAASITICWGWIFVVIASMIVLSAGGRNYPAVGFRHWREAPFTNGFKGFLSVMPMCIFAMAGSKNCGLAAAETANPKKPVSRAVGSIWLCLALFRLLGSLMVTIDLSPYNPDLFGGEGTNASPFVIAYRDSGAHPHAHLMDVVILISAVHDGLVPTFILGSGLAYLNVSNSGVEVFGWLSNLTSLFTVFDWGMICLSHIRMRTVWARQGRTAEELPWKRWLYPYDACCGLFLCIALSVVQFYSKCRPWTPALQLRASSRATSPLS